MGSDRGRRARGQSPGRRLGHDHADGAPARIVRRRRGRGARARNLGRDERLSSRMGPRSARRVARSDRGGVHRRGNWRSRGHRGDQVLARELARRCGRTRSVRRRRRPRAPRSTSTRARSATACCRRTPCWRRPRRRRTCHSDRRRSSRPGPTAYAARRSTPRRWSRNSSHCSKAIAASWLRSRAAVLRAKRMAAWPLACQQHGRGSGGSSRPQAEQPTSGEGAEPLS